MRGSMLFFWAGFVALVLFASCKHSPYIPVMDVIDEPVDTSQPCNPNTVYFVNQIQPILVSNCAKPGCHDSGTRTDGYDFSSYSGFINTNAVRGGDLNDSELWEVINETDPDKIMPPPGNTPLTADQKNMLRTWILDGAQNNGCTETTCDTANQALAADVKPILQAFCYGCHSTAGANAAGAGINLETYASLQTYATNGKLLCAINQGAGCSAMPKGGNRMPQCEIDKIQSWVNAGALNN